MVVLFPLPQIAPFLKISWKAQTIVVDGSMDCDLTLGALWFEGFLRDLPEPRLFQPDGRQRSFPGELPSSRGSSGTKTTASYSTSTYEVE